MKKKKKKDRRSIRAFVLTFSMCMLSFGLVYGLSVAYINTSGAINKQQVEIIDLYQTSFENAELNVFGEKFNIKIKEKKSIPPMLYVLIPPDIRAIFFSMDYLSEQLDM